MLKRILYELSGVDNNILAQCPPKWRGKYLRGGYGMLWIGVLCMLSGGYTFWVIFGNVVFAVGFSLIWAMVILNLYRLVLITVGSPFMPHSPKYRFPCGSFLFRTGFLLTLGLFVVKPMELMLMHGVIAPSLEAHRAEVIAEHKARAEQFEQAQIREIFASGNLAMERASEGGYLMARLEIMHRDYPGVWGLSALLLWTFMWPFWARVAWRRRSAYEEYRGEVEHRLIQTEYAAFKVAFTAHMLALTGRDDIWEEPYHDMPICNEPIVRAEQDYMRKGAIHAWARIFAQEGKGGPKP